jgi:hypothetical protein
MKKKWWILPVALLAVFGLLFVGCGGGSGGGDDDDDDDDVVGGGDWFDDAVGMTTGVKTHGGKDTFADGVLSFSGAANGDSCLVQITVPGGYAATNTVKVKVAWKQTAGTAKITYKNADDSSKWGSVPEKYIDVTAGSVTTITLDPSGWTLADTANVWFQLNNYDNNPFTCQIKFIEVTKE